jgi:CHAT domain-containing protein
MSERRIVLAEYFTTEDLTLLFIVRADFDEPQVAEIKVPLEDIRRFVSQYFGTSAESDGAAVATAGKKIRTLDEDAYQDFFGPFLAPIVPWTEEDDIVWLVPHDMLHYLPLHALKVDGRYLIERNPVCYTPSASVMKYCHAKRKDRRDRVLILADSRADQPLLHAREQALAIQQLFAPSAEAYLNGAATKGLVRQRLAEAGEDIDILHFACHGYFDRYQALKSGIKLAPENDDTSGNEETQEVEQTDESLWNLTAEEIFGLEMRADLVTLSACESGVNERRPGDELIGLTRALIYAGTPSVVVSLWSVDEISTSILMSRFYQALKDGANKAEALQKAQIGLMGTTIRDTIAYCGEAKERLTGSDAPLAQRSLSWDIADLQFAARDFRAALEGYSGLRAGLEPSSDGYRSLSVAMSRCRHAMRDPGPVDYEMTVYTHPYYWAPFTLVGDWK